MILITNPDFLASETQIINQLFEHGLDTLHVRKPDYTRDQLAEFISEIDARFHSQLMLHSHYDLLIDFEGAGIHFTAKTKHLLPHFDLIECKKSVSIHHLDELDEVNSTVDYILLCPLFPSVSKKGYSRIWDLEAIKQLLTREREFDVVALGGITLDNVSTVRAMGFDDFAVLGSIWERAKSTDLSVQDLVQTFISFKHEN